jgi:hypothetical protein
LIPLLAVTGSIDQQGRVQATGGATRKVEGFFDVCRSKGLTGKQGVLILASNIRDLVLRKEIVDAVKEGKFHVYGFEPIGQGVELLMGVAAGEADDDGKYPDVTISAKVAATLEAMKVWRNACVVPSATRIRHGRARNRWTSKRRRDENSIRARARAHRLGSRGEGLVAGNHGKQQARWVVGIVVDRVHTLLEPQVLVGEVAIRER